MKKIEKKLESQKPKGKSPLKKYWANVKSGKIQRVKPWSKKKKIKTGDIEVKEIKEEEPRPEIKLEKTSPDEEAEEIKKELDKKVSDEKTLEKPKIEIEKPEIPEIKDSDANFLIYGIIILVATGLGLGLLSRKNSSQVSKPGQSTQPKTRKFDIGGGKIIDIPI
ncbi:MAG: hypothetical protein ACKKMV_00440 [Candidatus Nealsonbacteria bacterium]